MLRRTLPVLVAMLIAFGSTLAAQKIEKIRVFVKPTQTAVGSFVDASTQRLADSRRDLVERLKDELLELVEVEDRADVVLELTSSAEEAFGIQSTTLDRGIVTGRVVGSTTETPTRPTVRVALNAGPYTNEIMGGGPNWRMASLEAAMTIRKWIKSNRETLLSKRVP